MSMMLFILLTIICVGLIYLVHRYYGKYELYLLNILYSVLSFLLSFKLVKIAGLNINLGIIFNAGIIILLYYFINRFSKSDTKKFVIMSIMTTISCIVIFSIISFMEPSLYDNNISLFNSLMFDNILLLILYPIGLTITLLISTYAFSELKKVQKKKVLKTILALIGIVFVDVFIFIYFTYVTISKYGNSLLITLDNYIFKAIIIIIMYFCILKILKVKKVKA